MRRPRIVGAAVLGVAAVVLGLVPAAASASMMTAAAPATAAVSAAHSGVAAPAASKTQPWGLYQSTNNLNYTIGASPEYKFELQYYGWSENPQSAEISAMPSGMVPLLEMQTCLPAWCLCSRCRHAVTRVRCRTASR
ncbi:MAG TPA: hypothetical protein VMS08_05340 [Candidatus Saccharimonadia bacterium]|jgi:hypothetical protein|nr:hypothetical protein [Candidatus Saccharimonadia bacterium]